MLAKIPFIIIIFFTFHSLKAHHPDIGINAKIKKQYNNIYKLSNISSIKNPDLNIHYLVLYKSHLNLANYCFSLIQIIKKQFKQNQFITAQTQDLLYFTAQSYLRFVKGIVAFLERLDNHSTKKNSHQLKVLMKTSLRFQLMEKYYDLYRLLTNNKTIRRILKEKHTSKDLKYIKKLTKKILDQEQIRSFTVEINQLKIQRENFNNLENHIYQNILKHKFYLDIVNNGEIINLDDDTFFLSDHIDSFIKKIASFPAWFFGITFGNINIRNGHLYSNKKFLKMYQKKLSPLDLIFEKKSFKITDYTIPGYFGHVGVWLGTKDELMKYGLWEKAELAPFREQILAGNSIFEMRRWGTTFEKLKLWLNLDETAIIRVKKVKNLHQHQVLQIYKKLASQINMQYDFSFDVMTGNEITCTELIAKSYGQVDWPVESIMGRYTLLPDHMAVLAFNKSPQLKFIGHWSSNDEGKITSHSNNYLKGKLIEK